jgi:hypothetical protein
MAGQHRTGRAGPPVTSIRVVEAGSADQNLPTIDYRTRGVRFGLPSDLAVEPEIATP